MSLFSKKFQKPGGPSLLNRAAPLPKGSAAAAPAAGQGQGAAAAAGKGQGAAAAGQGQGAAQGNMSEQNKKEISAFALYGTTIEELKKLGEQGKNKIKKAFIKIAIKNHPDKWQQKPNNNNKKAATARFKEYSEARDIIAKAMGWAENFESEKGGGTRRRHRRNRKTRKN